MQIREAFPHQFCLFKAISVHVHQSKNTLVCIDPECSRSRVSTRRQILLVMLSIADVRNR